MGARVRGHAGSFGLRAEQDEGWGPPLPRVCLPQLGLALAQQEVAKRKRLLLALRLMAT